MSINTKAMNDERMWHKWTVTCYGRETTAMTKRDAEYVFDGAAHCINEHNKQHVAALLAYARMGATAHGHGDGPPELTESELKQEAGEELGGALAALRASGQLDARGVYASKELAAGNGWLEDAGIGDVLRVVVVEDDKILLPALEQLARYSRNAPRGNALSLVRMMLRMRDEGPRAKRDRYGRSFGAQLVCEGLRPMDVHTWCADHRLSQRAYLQWKRVIRDMNLRLYANYRDSTDVLDLVRPSDTCYIELDHIAPPAKRSRTGLRAQ